MNRSRNLGMFRMQKDKIRPREIWCSYETEFSGPDQLLAVNNDAILFSWYSRGETDNEEDTSFSIDCKRPHCKLDMNWWVEYLRTLPSGILKCLLLLSLSS